MAATLVRSALYQIVGRTPFALIRRDRHSFAARGLTPRSAVRRSGIPLHDVGKFGLLGRLYVVEHHGGAHVHELLASREAVEKKSRR
jgi:hypothetical protein